VKKEKTAVIVLEEKVKQIKVQLAEMNVYKGRLITQADR
jgi:hypothetical protein